MGYCSSVIKLIKLFSKFGACVSLCLCVSLSSCVLRCQGQCMSVLMNAKLMKIKLSLTQNICNQVRWMECRESGNPPPGRQWSIEGEQQKWVALERNYPETARADFKRQSDGAVLPDLLLSTEQPRNFALHSQWTIMTVWRATNMADSALVHQGRSDGSRSPDKTERVWKKHYE